MVDSIEEQHTMVPCSDASKSHSLPGTAHSDPPAGSLN